ncbi:helix-turn-helix transcriptional regulator [Hazenella sp. IB182357]|uniref:Helix-turn-helix transcriptional regulator n=1 Tax=Polycladospora coralii TaxID=2771432 RepID=A0A926NC03_9BACL|nr:helix-turn-helix transcriptional regulator [Polycladospora coralii]MBD1373777.1 helix-turn-helix transcriptional regulator [Polycladospora coralii]
MTIADRVAQRILDLCDEHNITLNKLGTISGVTQSTLNSIVKGESKHPRLDTIEKICSGLGITMVEFFNVPDFNVQSNEGSGHHERQQ